MYRVDAAMQNGAIRRLCLRLAPAGALLQESTKARLRAEAEVMRAVVRSGVVVPEVVGSIPLGGPLGEGFFTEWLEGETLGQKIVASPDLARVREGGRLGRQCGEAIARVQMIDPSTLTSVAALEITQARQSPLERAGRAGDVATLREAYVSLGICRPAFDYTFAWLEARTPQEQEAPVLVHGDFRNGNVMVNAESGLVAVLDWELLHVGSRYEDLGWLCTRSWRFSRQDLFAGGFADLEDLCDGYEAAGGAPLHRATVRWWALFGSLKWAMLSLGMGAGFLAAPTRVEHGVVGRRVSESELDCLCSIADVDAGGPAAVLASGSLGDIAEAPSTRFPADKSLLDAVASFLRDSAAPSLASAGDERRAFLARAAANALGIVMRGAEEGPWRDAWEAASLRRILDTLRPGASELGAEGLLDLQWQLAAELRAGRLTPEAPGLLEHLLRHVAHQVSIDQPKYVGLASLRSLL